MEVHLLERVVGLEKEVKVEPITVKDILMLTSGTTTTVGMPTSIKKDLVQLKLKLPICAEKNDRIVISRRIGQRWRLIGYGVLQ